MVVQDPAACTHLAAPFMVRTQKLVCAIASAPVIISTDFVDSCLDANQLQSPENFLLDDPQTEDRLGFKLRDALDRAKKNKHRLLAGHTMYCTKGVHGGFDTYKAIIETNGGSCSLYQARPGTVSLSIATSNDNDNKSKGKNEFIYLISGTSPEEKKLWGKFKETVLGKDATPRIVKTDWMLDVAMSQEMRWHANYDLSEGLQNHQGRRSWSLEV